MKIRRRIVNAKRHTLGFVLTDHRRVSRKDAVRLANRGSLDGVKVVTSTQGTYLQSTGTKSLYDLPLQVDRDGRL